ncbi:MAG: inositol monophosphatase [SAR324 cluster bacterium]|nr:inositol monophosphatase [SAR324 cluster bacterium]MBL7034474.1 inositol monophosphatase [SAR324 cluster bacterium]
MKEQAIQSRFHAAQVLVRDAGLYALQWYRKLDSLQTEKKGPQDWVSEADREVENMIRKRLYSLFPEDGFLGEESGFQDLDAKGIWVVDPIDGTSCFLNGLSSWCVSIAYIVENQIEIGLIYAPCTDELFAVQRGAGATLNGFPMKPSQAGSLAEGIVGLGYSPKSSITATQKAFDYLFNNGGVFHDIGSAALMNAYVAAGRYIGFYEFQINSWDCLAGIAMVRETGGWTNDFLADDGLRTGNPLLTAAPGAKDAMQKLFAAAGH